jgi:hypothetical protein
MGIEPAGHSVRQLMFATLPRLGSRSRQRSEARIVAAKEEQPDRKTAPVSRFSRAESVAAQHRRLLVTSISTWAMTMLGFTGVDSPAIARRRVGTRLFPSPDRRPQSDLFEGPPRGGLSFFVCHFERKREWPVYVDSGRPSLRPTPSEASGEIVPRTLETASKATHTIQLLFVNVCQNSASDGEAHRPREFHSPSGGDRARKNPFDHPPAHAARSIRRCCTSILVELRAGSPTKIEAGR